MRLKSKRQLALDLEMSVVREPMYIKRTGLKNEIIQIGAVIIDEKYNIVDTFSTYVHPQHSKVDRYIRELTGITPGLLRDAPNLYDAIKELSDWIGPEPISVISWGKTDLNQLKKELKYKKIHIKNIDALFAVWNDFQKTFSVKVGVKRQFSLNTALDMAGLEPEGRAHDGLTDAYNMAKLYVYMKKNPKKKIYQKRVVTVTLNPALDKTIYVEKLVPGELHRLDNIEKDPGGKGINVSMVLRAMGYESIATGFIGGNIGDTIVKALKRSAIICDFVDIAEENRTNTKLVEKDGQLTELNEIGPNISDIELHALKQKIKKLAIPETLFVFSGSIPSSIPKSLYKDLIEIVHDGGALCILDADGEAFTEGIKQKPDYIKPNFHELESYLGHGLERKAAEIKKAAKELLKSGVGHVAITDGGNGAYYFSKKASEYARAMEVEVSSTVGAGDSFVAGLCIGFMKNESEKETFCTATALSAAAVTTQGTKPPKKELVATLIEKCVTEKI